MKKEFQDGPNIARDLTNHAVRFEMLANVVPDAIVAIDGKGRISFWNQGAEKMFLCDREKALGKDFHMLFAPKNYHQHYEEGFRQFHETGEGPILDTTREVFALRQNGDIFPVELNVSALKIDGELHSIGIMRDISSRFQTEEETRHLMEELEVSRDMVEQSAGEMNMLNIKLEESEQRLQELNATKDKFFSIIAHDLKNPFNALMGLSQVLMEDFDEMPEEMKKEFIGEMFQASTRTHTLLENLLEWARSQTGGLETDIEELDPAALIEEQVKLVQPQADNKGITIETDMQTPAKVKADKNTVSTVIRNLLTNAVKYSHQKGRIFITVKLRGSEVAFAIKDEGMGIPPERVEKLFELGGQKSTLGTSKEKGTGLGLILCKELIEKNDGTIAVKSKPGKGTTFSFILHKSE